MNALIRLHRNAMRLADQALSQKRIGRATDAEKLFEQALDLESAAADFCVLRSIPEPTFSIIHRSAANLALACNKPEKARALAKAGLNGTPPEDIKAELCKILDSRGRETSHRRGVKLNPEIKRLKLMISLEEKRRELDAQLDEVDSRLRILWNRLVEDLPENIPAKATVLTKSRQSSTKSSTVPNAEILAAIESAGARGVTFKNLASQLGIGAGSIRYWFATTGKLKGIRQTKGKLRSKELSNY